MIFEYVPNLGFNFLTSFAKKLQVAVHDGRLEIPASLGEGSIRYIDLSPEFKLILHKYKLKEDFVLRRKAFEGADDLISIIFRSNEVPVNLFTNENQIQFSKNNEFAVQISSTDIEYEIRFPANTEIYFTVVGITAERLTNLLNIQNPNNVVQTILSGTKGFLFYESMTPDLQKTIKQLADSHNDLDLSTLYYKIRVQELLYFLFEKLLKRESISHSPIFKADIDKLLVVRSAVLADISIPPSLARLAKMVGLSETKLKELFKQVFGDTIYNHYQKARMEEAAYLLKNGHSVSEVGYQLGFSNLSHFSRLFDKHYGVKPKKYSLV